MLKDRPNLKKVYICLDNDSAGIEGAYRIAESIRAVGEYELWRSMSKNKDWDEDLKELHGKAVIPAGRHKKMDVFFDLCTQAQDELQDRLPTLCKGVNIIFLNSGRLSALVPEIPSSAYIPAKYQSGRVDIISVYTFF